jgi:hypothetical protein
LPMSMQTGPDADDFGGFRRKRDRQGDGQGVTSYSVAVRRHHGVLRVDGVTDPFPTRGRGPNGDRRKCGAAGRIVIVGSAGARIIFRKRFRLT